MVSLRSLREAQGYDSRQLAERIRQQEGVDVHPDTLLNVELGHKRGSVRLMGAWARVLGIRPIDVRQHEELAALVSESAA